MSLRGVLITLLVFTNIAAAQESDTALGSRGTNPFISTAEDKKAFGRDVTGKNSVEKELNCVRKRVLNDIDTQVAKDPKSRAAIEQKNLFIRDEAKWNCLMQAMSGPLENSFKKFKMTNSIERSLYYTQLIAESGGLSKLSETKLYGNGQSCTQEGEFATGQIAIENAINDSFNTDVFNEGKGSHSLGTDRGYGPFQITGCSNRLSAIHYLNSVYRGETPDWSETWCTGPYTPRLENAKGERCVTEGNGCREVTRCPQIGQQCSEEEYKKVTLRYAQNNNNWNANLYGALRDSSKFASVGATFNDDVPDLSPTSNRVQPLPPLSSTEFMFDASLAFFRGRNKDTLSYMDKMVEESECFRNFKMPGDTYIDVYNRCITQRVRGLRPTADRELINKSADFRAFFLHHMVMCTDIP